MQSLGQKHNKHIRQGRRINLPLQEKFLVLEKGALGEERAKRVRCRDVEFITAVTVGLQDIGSMYIHWKPFSMWKPLKSSFYMFIINYADWILPV